MEMSQLGEMSQFGASDDMENLEDEAPLIQNQEEPIPPPEPNVPIRHKLWNWARFISPEVTVFSFIFVFYYYQNYIQQYFVQWYAKETLKSENVSLPSSSYLVCYTQTLITNLTGSNTTFNEIEGKAAHLNIMMLLATYMPSLVVNLIISPFSDKIGRKPVIVLVLTGEALAVATSITITYLSLDVYWFLVPAFLFGLSGGVSTLLAVSFAYVSDITPERWRTIHLGLIQAVVYISTAISSGVINVWLENVNCKFGPTSWLMVAVVVVGLTYSILMPESLSKQERVGLGKSKKGIAVLFQGIKMFFWPFSKYSKWRLWFVTLCIFVVVFGESGENAITTLFLLHKPLEWGRDFIGIYHALRSVAHAIVLFVVMPLLVLIKCPDALVAVIGIIITAGTNVFLGFVGFTWEMFLGKYIKQILIIPCSSFL